MKGEVKGGYCVECGRITEDARCEGCGEMFCSVCRVDKKFCVVCERIVLRGGV